MASATIRKAIGAVKDQTSISLAKVAGNVAPDLEVLVVKATTHDSEPADEKYAREILNMISYSKGYVNACVLAVSKRLTKTSDWIVALKALMLLHKLLNDGDPVFGREMLVASRKGTRVLNMSDFRDDAHSNSWDHSGFVRTFALYLDQKLEFIAYERKLNAADDDDEKKKKKKCDDAYGESRDEPCYGTDWRLRSYGDLSDSRKREENELTPERVLERLNQLLRLLNRFLASKPTGAAKKSRMVLVALDLLVKESFELCADIFEVLKYLLDSFSGLEHAYCVKAFDSYVTAAKMIDELIEFYNWCKDIELMRSSEFPEVERISDKLLGSLERLSREKANRPAEIMQSINEIKALPPPENYNPQTDPPVNQQVTEDLVNLKDDGVSADQQGNTLALALFSADYKNNEWVDREPKATSAWENPAAESGKADWEIMLVESASNLSKQQADLAGGFDSLLLNGMYDQGRVVKRQDPFAASLLVPPPSYVQIADMDRKQRLITQEQQLWQQYATTGHMNLPKISDAAAMPPHNTDLGWPAGYYNTSF